MFETEIRDDGVAWITLDRPELHNAFNDELIASLTALLDLPPSLVLRWCIALQGTFPSSN